MDHHAKILVSVEDAYRGAVRALSLQVAEHDSQGQVHWRERRVDVTIPRGVRPGQHLRLKGQGGAGTGGAPAGDLYLEVEFAADGHFRVDGADAGSRWMAAVLDSQAALWRDFERSSARLMAGWITPASVLPSAQPLVDAAQGLSVGNLLQAAQQSWNAWGQVWMNALGHDVSTSEPARRA